jgi:hypothetical protein
MEGEHSGLAGGIIFHEKYCPAGFLKQVLWHKKYPLKFFTPFVVAATPA